jgi:Lrp/AsnC family transcriptional regulator, regulator for asnA, asnC and gidA
MPLAVRFPDCERQRFTDFTGLGYASDVLQVALGLDKLDRSLIARLRQDGRQPLSEIAKELNVSEGTVRNRLNRLLDQAVMRVVAVPDPAKLGYPLDCILGLSVDLQHLHSVSSALAKCTEIRYVGIATGLYSLIIAGDFASEEHLLEFLTTRLAAIPGVQRTEAFRILKVVKRRDDPPVEDA